MEVQKVEDALVVDVFIVFPLLFLLVVADTDDLLLESNENIVGKDLLVALRVAAKDVQPDVL